MRWLGQWVLGADPRLCHMQSHRDVTVTITVAESLSHTLWHATSHILLSLSTISVAISISTTAFTLYFPIIISYRVWKPAVSQRQLT